MFFLREPVLAKMSRYELLRNLAVDLSLIAVRVSESVKHPSPVSVVLRLSPLFLCIRDTCGVCQNLSELKGIVLSKKKKKKRKILDCLYKNFNS